MGENLNTLNQFITKENFNSLSWCIVLVVGLTEILKLLNVNIEPRILVIFWSLIVSLSRTYLNNGITRENIKEKLLMAFFNIVPISIGAIGTYDMIVKTFLKN